ncbi:alpha/beta hydrolase [Candidatus Pacearchaeota archaeon]|nr:alpha/beta hydrolase [Candidatus Pacearchaeota archaeon]
MLNTLYCPGRKNVVIFIHGDLQNHTVFLSLSSFFGDKGHSTLLFDLPGHGNSKYERKDFLAMMDEIIKSYNIKNPIFVGHSFGGMLAAEYIKETGNTSSAVFLNAYLGRIKEARPSFDMDTAIQHYKKLAIDNFQEQKLVQYNKSGTKNESDVSLIGLQSTLPQAFEKNLLFYKKTTPEDALYQLDIPILYVATKDDDFIPSSYAIECMKKMKNGKLIIEEGTHNSIIINPQVIEKAIKDNYQFLVGQEA